MIHVGYNTKIFDLLDGSKELMFDSRRGACLKDKAFYNYLIKFSTIYFEQNRLRNPNLWYGPLFNSSTIMRQSTPDQWIAQLLTCQHLPEADMKTLCDLVRSILMEESNIQPVSSPVTICGDIHGQFWDLLELLRKGGMVPDTSYIFMACVLLLFDARTDV